MATILVGYDTETAAVGEALSLFTESPNFPRYELALDPETCARRARAVDRGARRRRRARDALRLRPDAAARPRAGARGEGLGPLRRAAAHVQPRAVQGHRLLARAPVSSATIAASPPEALLEELTVTSRADPRPPRRRGRRPADAVRLLPRPARPAGPAGDRARRRPPLHHLVGSQRGERQPDAVGAAVHLRGGGLPGHPRAAVPVLARRRLVRPARLRHRARATSRR